MLVYAKFEGAEHPVVAARNETVAKVKAMIALRCESLVAKMFSLRHGSVELKDSAALGDYHLSNGTTLEVCLAGTQPFAGMDYSKLARQLESDGVKKAASAYYNPDEYRGEWTKGDEYLSYPPVDVHNKWSAVAPSSSTDLTLSPKSKERSGKENGDTATSALPSRMLSQKYVCGVRNCESNILFKMEGKWSGRCDISGGEKMPTARLPLVSHVLTNFALVGRRSSITSSEGLSSSTKYGYTPIIDGTFHVDSDVSELSDCQCACRGRVRYHRHHGDQRPRGKARPDG